MSYSTTAKCTQDASFLLRLTAAIAAEGRTQPEQLAIDLRWPVAGASDIEAAYASALAADNPDPGGDETVITDQMLLSAVQANLTPP